MIKNFLGAVAALGVLTAAGAASAQVLSDINFTTTGASPTTTARYGSGQPCVMTLAATHTYQAVQVTVGATGAYAVTDQSLGDGGFAIYTGTYDPLNPAANCVASLDGGTSWTLTAGTYTLVGGPWSSVDPNGAHVMRFDGPAAVTLSAPAAVPTLSEWAMMLLGLMLAGGAAVHLQRRRLGA